MIRKTLIAIVLLVSIVAVGHAGDKSDGMKPRWMTSSLPTPKSPGYFLLSAQGVGKSLGEARQMSLYNLTEELEHKRGLRVTSNVSAKEIAERGSGMKIDSEFTIEITEKGKQIDVTCRVIDEYWERKDGRYVVTRLYAVNDPAKKGKGMNNDSFRKTTSYGAAPVFYSLIPGVGQFYKGSNVKGGLILGGTAVGAAAIIMTENQRAIYARKMKEHPEHIDFYRNKKANWELGRNIAIGATAALYVYNLIDAAVAPGRRRVVVSKHSYDYSIVPFVYDEGVGVSLALNF